MTNTDSEELYKAPCPNCESSDAFAVYDDGHGHCYSCLYHPMQIEGVEDTQQEARKPMAKDIIDPGEAMALPARGLTEATCQKWGYTVGKFKGKTVQIANYRDSHGNITAQKLRFANKEFLSLGDMKDAGLYGSHLWRNGGKRIVLTEGEVDALSVSQAFNNRWAVASIPNGGPSAKKALTNSLQWLLGFDEIVIMFDDDLVGNKAAEDVVGLFPPGRCKVARLPMKDANECLKAGKPNLIVDAVYEAKTFRPDGIVTIQDIKEAALVEPDQGFPWFSPELTKLTFGRRVGIYAFGAGTGVGKTDWLTEQMMYDITELKMPIGVFSLEQAPTETLTRIAGKFAGIPFHLRDGSWSQEQFGAAIDDLDHSGKLYLYDSFGATDWSVIRDTIRYLSLNEGVKLFYLDHLTALAAMEEDERRALEMIMAEMGALVKELGIIIHLVSHLATPDGTPHEEGGRVMIRHFKGSRAIGFWCHYMFGLERHQQHKNEALRQITTFRVLKDRFTGRATGQCLWFGYDHKHGRLTPVKDDPHREADQDTAVHEAFGQF